MKRSTSLLIASALFIAHAAADAATAAGGPMDCDVLRQQIATKIDANGVPSYSLQIVQAEGPSTGRIVGVCDGGRRRIAYRRIDLLPSSSDTIAAHELDVAVTLPAAR